MRAGCKCILLFCSALNQRNHPSDNAFGRVFGVQDNVTPNQTVEACIAKCAGRNFTIAGLEFSSRYLPEESLNTN